MNVDLTFPCDPRFALAVRDAVVAAARGAGLDDAGAAAASAALDRFLRECVREPQPTSIAAQVTDTYVRVTAAGRTLTVDL
jgi:hypothetical protein